MPERPAPDLTAYAVDLRPRHRPGVVVTVQLCTWDLVVLRVQPTTGGRAVYLAKSSEDVPALVRRLDSGALDAQLLEALRRPPRRRFARRPRPSRTLRVGVEHEYVVRDASGVVDFAGVVDALDLGIRADPTDPHAQRCPWGGVITADGREAEVATPPVTVRPGALGQVTALAGAGRASLAASLGDHGALEGYSTHLNVSARRHGDRVLATRFARVFAPSLMLLLDRATSPGLLVRPRPGRLELGGEYAEGPALEVALAFALGATLACQGVLRRRLRVLEVEVALVPAVERYGWYVDRLAFGADLYDLGRDAPLRRAHTGTFVTAGQQLLDTWRIARAALGDRLAPDEVARVDEIVRGTVPLPRAHDGVAS